MTVGRGTPTDGGSAQTIIAVAPLDVSNGRTLYANTIIELLPETEVADTSNFTKVPLPPTSALVQLLNADFS